MRIISGTARGARLKTPKGLTTRPTLDRVREAMFSKIIGLIPEASVLDLFAGSGALGIEALSRGATKATFVEVSKEALAVIRDNLEKVKLRDRANVVPSAVDPFLKNERGSFDVIFADPPYLREETGEDWATRLLEKTTLPERLKEGGVFVLETNADYRMHLPAHWELLDERTYGKTRLWYLVPAKTNS